MCVFVIVFYYLTIIYLYQQALFSCKFGTVLTIFVSVYVWAYNTWHSFLALLIGDTRNDDIIEHSYYGTKMEAASADAASVKCVLTGTVHGATTQTADIVLSHAVKK